MAYSNWGAFVYKDGQRRTNREDVGVFDEDEAELPSGARIFANIAKAREKYGAAGEKQPAHEHSHHAVLGDGPVRLAGYKYHVDLWHLAEDGTVTNLDLDQFEVKRSEYGTVETLKGEYEGCRFTAELDEDSGNLIDLTLTEADGAEWTSRCGYLYGAGHMDLEGAQG